MSERRLVLALAACWLGARASAVRAQGSKVWRVGVLSPRRRPASFESDYYGAFPRRLHELGYVEGSNLVLEWRFAEGDYSRLPAMAADLLQFKVDVLVALGPPGAAAAQRATATIPIVFVVSSDPVASGLVKSLARPGGNITGLSNLAGDLSFKHLELLTALVPRLSHVAVLLNPTNPDAGNVAANLQRLASKASLRTLPLKAQNPAAIDAAIDQAAAAKADALMVSLDPLFIQQAGQIAARSLAQRLPSIFANREYAEAGGLVSYGQNQIEIYQRLAVYVDKILKGASPAELPVEQPTRLELLINAHTAKKLGVTIPQSLRISADRLIE